MRMFPKSSVHFIIVQKQTINVPNSFNLQPIPEPNQKCQKHSHSSIPWQRTNWRGHAKCIHRREQNTKLSSVNHIVKRRNKNLFSLNDNKKKTFCERVRLCHGDFVYLTQQQKKIYKTFLNETKVENRKYQHPETEMKPSKKLKENVCLAMWFHFEKTKN